MRILIVLAHPDARSFNGQLADRAVATLEANGHTVELSDLYRQEFDPLEHPRHYGHRECPDRFDVQNEQRAAAARGQLPADVQRELEKLHHADLLILQYPLWWYQPPAMMKGWIDRVLVYGELYTSRLRYDRGKLKGKRAMLSVTLGGPASTYAHNGRNGDADLLLWPMQMTLSYVGMSVLSPFAPADVFGDAEDPDVQKRLRVHLEAYTEHLRNVDILPTIPFNGWADWDEHGRLRADASEYSLFMRHRP